MEYSILFLRISGPDDFENLYAFMFESPIWTLDREYPFAIALRLNKTIKLSGIFVR
jgi:hypothetical protein